MKEDPGFTKKKRGGGFQGDRSSRFRFECNSASHSRTDRAGGYFFSSQLRLGGFLSPLGWSSRFPGCFARFRESEKSWTANDDWEKRIVQIQIQRLEPECIRSFCASPLNAVCAMLAFFVFFRGSHCRNWGRSFLGGRRARIRWSPCSPRPSCLPGA
jgi:hypothetical protein